MKTLTVFTLSRPEGLPLDWVVFNAPRPLPGDIAWKGDFNHGIHYSALDPRFSETERKIMEDIDDHDGWRVILTTEQEFLAWTKPRLKSWHSGIKNTDPLLGILRKEFLRERFGVEE